MTTDTPKRKRRWFQFRLRTLLLLVTVFAVWFGWLAHQARQQKETVAWVREMEGTVYYDYEVDEDGQPIDDAKPPGPKWLRDIVGIDFMADVVEVNLTFTQVSDVTPLAGLTSLQELTLINTPVSDLTPLAGLTNLQKLDLWGAPVSDLTPLAGLTNLQELDLAITPVSDVTPLAGLTNLQELRLSSTQVSDLTPLAGLTNLQVLRLDGTPVSEEEVTRLRQALPKCEIREGLWR
jgi:hypothetical protein